MVGCDQCVNKKLKTKIIQVVIVFNLNKTTKHKITTLKCRPTRKIVKQKNSLLNE